MKFYRITITSWRDRAAAKRATRQATELAEATVQLELVEKRLATEEANKIVDGKTAESLKLERDRLVAARASLLEPEEQEGFESSAAATRHPMVGKSGYQIVDDRTMSVVRLVDANGNDFPGSAVFEYELVEVDAPDPTWAAEKLDQWFPKEGASLEATR